MGHCKNKEMEEYEKKNKGLININYSDSWPVFRGELMSPKKMIEIILSETNDKKEE